MKLRTSAPGKGVEVNSPMGEIDLSEEDGSLVIYSGHTLHEIEFDYLEVQRLREMLAE